MYTPKIKEEYIYKLYQLKQVRKKPMTKLVNEAVRDYLHKNKSFINKEESYAAEQR